MPASSTKPTSCCTWDSASLLAALAIRWAPRYPRECGAFVAAAIPAVYLAVAGNTLQHRWALWLHIALALAAVALIGWRVFGAGRYRAAFAACVSVLLLLPASAALWRTVRPDPDNVIVNPASPPLSMDEEGAGAQSPFAPSSAQTNTGKIIPSNFFMDSETCGECHKDIYEQWKSSMHHFASFNNQFYRKAIEYMQDVIGTRPSKWCAGCHDHAVFFNGRFDRPIKEQIDTPEAQAGPRLHVLPRHRARRQQHGERRFHAWSIRRCTSSPPATTRTSARWITS